MPMRYTLADFKKEYPNDEACLQSVLENRYGDTCPRCGVVGVTWHPITGRQGFVCSECDKHVYPLANTIFRKTTTPLKDWFYAIYLFSVSKNGVSAKELERHLGVTYKTAWRMCKQIRLLMKENIGKVGGDDDPVEVDETFIGGKGKNRAHVRRDIQPNKQAVFGMIERHGGLRAYTIKGIGARALLPEIRRGVYRNTQIYSDEYGSYKSLPKVGYRHAAVKHSQSEYGRGDVHTNTIEGFWSLLKRSISGTYVAVSPKYLNTYVQEFVFRYNYRKTSISRVLLAKVGTRV